MKNLIPFKGRTLDIKAPVLVYRCLNRKGKIYSIRQKDLVVGHSTDIIISNAEFIINKSGKKTAIRTNERNVHAFIKGFINLDESYLLTHRVGYNPFSQDGFTVDGLTPSTGSERIVCINSNGVTTNIV